MKRYRDTVIEIFKNVAVLKMNAPISIREDLPNLESQFHGQEIISRGKDLIIMAPGQLAIVKADRSGGIQALMNWWAYLAQSPASRAKKVQLFYIFLASNGFAVQVHRALWEFTRAQVRMALGDLFEAFFAAYVRPPALDCHEEIPAPVIGQCEAELEAQWILARFRGALSDGTNTPPATILAKEG